MEKNGDATDVFIVVDGDCSISTVALLLLLPHHALCSSKRKGEE